MADLKAYILQNGSGKILATETSLKKLVTKHTEDYNLLSYQYLQRLCKGAKNKGEKSITFNSKLGSTFQLSWWKL